MTGTIALGGELLLQHTALDLTGLDAAFPFQDLNELGDAAAGYFPPKEDGLHPRRLLDESTLDGYWPRRQNGYISTNEHLRRGGQQSPASRGHLQPHVQGGDVQTAKQRTAAPQGPGESAGRWQLKRRASKAKDDETRISNVAAWRFFRLRRHLFYTFRSIPLIWHEAVRELVVKLLTPIATQAANDQLPLIPAGIMRCKNISEQK